MNHSKAGVKGFVRVQLVDNKTKKVVGDSGWRRNKVTNNGLNSMAALSMAVAGSYAVGYAAVGKGSTSDYAANTALNSVENSYVSVSVSTAATGTAQATCSFNGTANSATITVQEVGLFKTNSAGSLVAATSFTGSQFTSDQTLNMTYQLRFATA